MKRILLMVFRNLWFVPWAWCKLCYRASHTDKYTEEEHYKLLKYIDHRANTSGNIHIEVHGQENIPEQDGFMFYPNHQGLYDVLAIMEACPRPFAVVAKKEVADVPFLTIASITAWLLLPFPTIAPSPRSSSCGAYLSILLAVVGPADPIGLPSLAGDGPIY